MAMADIKQPQDHKSPKGDGKTFFSFEGPDGKVTFPNAIEDTLTMGWMRKHRHLDPADQVFTGLEALAGTGEDGAAALDAFDTLDSKRGAEVLKELEKAIGAGLGE